MFDSVSQYADQVDGGMLYIIGFSILMLIGVTIVMLAFVFKYHHKRHPKPKQTHGSLALEMVWIVIPTIIVISMFWVGWVDYGNLKANEDYDEMIKINVRNWEWYFNYDNGIQLKSDIIKDLDQRSDLVERKKEDNRSLELKTNEFVLPVGKRIKVMLVGDDETIPADFIHSFYLPAFRIKEDIVPGRTTFLYITPEKEGTYTLTCTEYCGQWHSRMYANVKVVPADEYYAWKADNDPEKEEVAEEATEETNEEEVALVEEVQEDTAQH